MTTEIADILKGYITGYFVDRLAGKVRTVRFKAEKDGGGSTVQTYPVACNVSASDCVNNNSYQDLVPNSGKRSVVYFEDNGGMRMTGKVRGRQMYEADLRLVVWLNLKLLGQTDCNYASSVYGHVTGLLPMQPVNTGSFSLFKVSGISMPNQDASIFSKYTYDETVNQYILFPYDYFAMDIKVSFGIRPDCLPAIGEGDVSDCEVIIPPAGDSGNAPSLGTRPFAFKGNDTDTQVIDGTVTVFNPLGFDARGKTLLSLLSDGVGRNFTPEITPLDCTFTPATGTFVWAGVVSSDTIITGTWK